MCDINHQLADLLEYPAESWRARVDSPSAFSEENGALAEFLAAVDLLSLTQLQELYTRTFDLNPVCALEIGYHLFGENYKRGEFLANLRETEAPFDLGQKDQLPDYLPVLLRLLTKSTDEELKTSLIAECMLPAIAKMLKSFNDNDNPYQYLLKALQNTLLAQPGVESAVVRRQVATVRTSLPVLTNDPLNNTNVFEAERLSELSATELRAALDRRALDLF